MPLIPPQQRPEDFSKNPNRDWVGAFSLIDILEFLQNSWKIIFIFIFFGFIASVIYLWIAPKNYEATAQIQLAQINFSNAATPLGTPIEEVAALITRMRNPSNYDKTAVTACNYQSKLEPALSLSKDIKLISPKGVTNMVELKVVSSSPQEARDCALVLAERVIQMQNLLAKPYIEEAKLNLERATERIDSARRLSAKSDQLDSGISPLATYLISRDELAYYLSEREKMLKIIDSAAQRGAKLTSPIYAPERAVSPKKAMSLMMGFLTGLFLGLGVAVVCHFLPKRHIKA